MTQHSSRQDMVFMMSLMPRSGTNFLAELLALHPDCARAVVDEDGLLARSQNLIRFANQLTKVWQGDGNLEDLAPYDPTNRLLRSFGDGLVGFLVSIQDDAKAPRPKYLLSKTPRVSKIEHFFKLFPDAPLIVLLRDGRAVVESFARSFGHDFEFTVREWAASARHLRKVRPQLAGQRVLFVRYEDLLCEQRSTLAGMFEFLEFAPDSYDFAQAEELPVFGSSDLAAQGGKVDWKPRKKTADFNPLARAAEWDWRKRSRFDWLAGNELRALGYGNDGAPVPQMALWNRWRDLVWSCRRLLKLLRNLPQLARRARRILSQPL